ncbi:hypothetical protein J6590_062363 [Homalodisca vitripennis]|nr:hypothetical protein J6590_062363 [Homalodisca vitripennis]
MTSRSNSIHISSDVTHVTEWTALQRGVANPNGRVYTLRYDHTFCTQIKPRYVTLLRHDTDTLNYVTTKYRVELSLHWHDTDTCNNKTSSGAQPCASAVNVSIRTALTSLHDTDTCNDKVPSGAQPCASALICYPNCINSAVNVSIRTALTALARHSTCNDKVPSGAQPCASAVNVYIRTALTSLARHRHM